MSNIVERKHALPEWQLTKTGQMRLQGGRWNMERVAEFLAANPFWHTPDDLARLIYGTSNKKNRDNVRKHIPAQRRYMLNSLEKPIVTRYAHRGRIERIKFYDSTSEEDRAALKIELDRLLDRKEVTDKRYSSLLQVFRLSGPPTWPPPL